MLKRGFLFSGQGAQAVGMGKTLHQHHPSVRDLYARASEVLGWDLAEVSFHGPEERLTETAVCQPALFVHGYAAYTVVKEAGLVDQPAAVAGLSLGELTALAVAQSFDFETGLQLVAARGQLMQEACEATDGAMASIIGGSPEEVEALCRDFDIDVANFNCPGQIVISGPRERIQAAVESGKSRGFKLVRPLKVAGAYHSRLMAVARDRFEEVVRQTPIAAPQVPFYANVTGFRAEDPGEIASLLVRQVVSPVRFDSCLVNLVNDQELESLVECGTGRILAGLAKRTVPEVSVLGVSEDEDLEVLARGEGGA